MILKLTDGNSDSGSEAEYDFNSRLGNEAKDEDVEEGEDAKSKLLEPVKPKTSKSRSAVNSPAPTPSKSTKNKIPALSSSSPSASPRGSTPGFTERVSRQRSDIVKSGTTTRPGFSSRQMTKPMFEIPTFSPMLDSVLASAKFQTPSPRTPSQVMAKKDSGNDSPAFVSSSGPAKKGPFGEQLGKPVNADVLAQIRADRATSSQVLPTLNTVDFRMSTGNVRVQGCVYFYPMRN